MKVLHEENSTGTATYIYGPAGKLAKRTTINGETNIFYYHNDHLGSTRLVTDSNKNIVTAVTYHPFGESYSVEGEEDYLFCGKEKDETGLYYYGARHYDPDLGRFLTRDPYSDNLVKPQSLNQYTYYYNNPQKYIDPTGTDEERKTAQQKVEEIFPSLQGVDPDELTHHFYSIKFFLTHKLSPLEGFSSLIKIPI